MSQTPEKKIENKIRTDFEAAGGYIKKFFASPHTNKGIPDLIGVLRGRYVALEVKRPTGGKPTPVQIKNLQEIANADGIALITNDPEIINILVMHFDHNTIKSQKLKSKNEQVKIDYANIPSSGIDEKEARRLWQQSTGPHSLQILKRR